jgi:hypothetical protein
METHVLPNVILCLKKKKQVTYPHPLETSWREMGSPESQEGTLHGQHGAMTCAVQTVGKSPYRGKLQNQLWKLPSQSAGATAPAHDKGRALLGTWLASLPWEAFLSSLSFSCSVVPFFPRKWEEGHSRRPSATGLPYSVLKQ